MRARRRFAGREARNYLENALALVPLLSDPTEQRRAELQVRLTLGRTLGDISFAAESVRENYDRASELCATLGSTAELFEAIYARWYLHGLRAERDETIALAAELDRLAEQTGAAEHRVVADSVLVRTAFYEGRFTDAQRHMESLFRRFQKRHNGAPDRGQNSSHFSGWAYGPSRLLARLPEQSDSAEPVDYGVDPVIAAILHYAGALWFLGNLDGAQKAAAEGLARARESGNPFFLSAALGQHALIDLLGRNTPREGSGPSRRRRSPPNRGSRSGTRLVRH